MTIVDKIPASELVISGGKQDYVFFISPEFNNDLEFNPVIKVGDRAEANIYYCFFGQYNINIKLEYNLGNQAKVNHYLIFIASHSQQLSFKEKYVFQGQGTLGRFNIRGLVKDEAQAICDSNITIAPGAQQTDAYLDMQGVIMDRTAKVEMIPGLQIEANNIKASHAAKISMLDDEQLFYLRSRGLTAEQAKNFFVDGMFGEIVAKIPDEDVKNKILEIIKDKLYGRN